MRDSRRDDRPTGKQRPRIVVGTNGTPASCWAVEKAAEIAVQRDAELIVVAAYEPASPAECARYAAGLGEELAYQVRGSSPAEHDAREALCYARRAGADARYVVREGKPAPVLRAVAKEVRAGLLVVGRSRARGLAGLLTSSTQACVQASAPCQVLVVNTRGHKPTDLYPGDVSLAAGSDRGPGTGPATAGRDVARTF